MEEEIQSLEGVKAQLLKGTVTHRDKKMRDLKVDLTRLENAKNHVEEDKYQVQQTHDHLLKEIKNIETRLYNAKQLVYREVEKYY